MLRKQSKRREKLGMHTGRKSETGNTTPQPTRRQSTLSTLLSELQRHSALETYPRTPTAARTSSKWLSKSRDKMLTS